MLGRFRFSDEALAGDDGTFDSGFVVITLGVLLPLAIVALAAYVVAAGGITLHGRGGPPVRYDGPHAVVAVVTGCVGVALLLVSKFLLPNVFRRSYRYQYAAAAGAVLACAGLVSFVAAAFT